MLFLALQMQQQGVSGSDGRRQVDYVFEEDLCLVNYVSTVLARIAEADLFPQRLSAITCVQYHCEQFFVITSSS